MADYDSSLPTRSENPGDHDIFVSDSVTPANKLKVNADGSISIDDNGGSVTVDGVDFDIRDLTSATDSVEVLQDTHDDLNANVTIQVADVDVSNANPVPVSDAGGSLTVDAVDLDIRDLTSASDSVEVLQDTHDDLNCNANMQVGDTDVSATNPIPVAFSPDALGDEICDFNSSVAVAAAATVNHDYTVTAAKTFIAEEAWISGSGKLRVEVLLNGVTAFVGFNSTANPNVRIPMEKICKAGALEVIRISILNRDKQPQDLYSTLLGSEV